MSAITQADLEAVKADRRPHWNDTLAYIQALLKSHNVDTGKSK